MDGGGAAAVSCTHRHRHSGLAAGPSVRDRSFQKTYSAGQQRCGRGRCEREEKGAEKEGRGGERKGSRTGGGRSAVGHTGTRTSIMRPS